MTDSTTTFQAQLEYDGCVFPLQNLNWQGVLEAAQKLNVHNVDDSAFYVTYHDEDDEKVTVKCDKDVEEAVLLTKELMRPCLALSVPFVSDDDWVKDDFSTTSRRTPVPVSSTQEDAPASISNEQMPPELRGYDDVIDQQSFSGISEVKSEIAEVERGIAVLTVVEPLAREQVVQAAPAIEDQVEQVVDDDVVAPEPLAAPVELVVQQDQSAQQDKTAQQAQTAQQDQSAQQVQSAQQDQSVQQGSDMLFAILARSFRKGIEGGKFAQSAASSFREALAESLSDRKAVDALIEITQLPIFVDAIVAAASDYRQGSDATAIKAGLVEKLGASFFKALTKAPELGALLPYVLERASLFEEPVLETKSVTDSAPMKSEPFKPIIVHTGVRCDGCNVLDFEGVRYKSAILPDYDLCETCEASGAFDDRCGPFLKIRNPAQAPDAILCVLRAAGRAPRENLDWRNPLAREFLEFVNQKNQRSFQSSSTRPPAPLPPPVAVIVDTPTVAAEKAPVEQAPATSEPIPACCRGKHVLTRFLTPHFGFSCNVCSQRQRAGSVMHGCRPCDFDVCSTCFDAYAAQNATQVAPASVSAPAPPQAKFVSDVTMTDGCMVQPGEHLIKTWRVRNAGTEPWPIGVRIAHVGGNSFGGPAAGVEVPRANPGEAVNVSVPLIMPTEPGRHTSYWRMITPHPTNAKFGHRFWVTVNVVPQPSMDMFNFTYPPVPVMYPTAVPAPSSVVLPPNTVEEPIVDAALETAVAQVTELGFSDIDKIVRVLREEDGDTGRTIDRLLAENGA